jgi:hemerythrin superfamily protein
MNIYTYLKTDHQAVHQLFKRIALSSKKETIEKLFADVSNALLLHAETEHQTFYQALRSHDEMEDIIAHADEEHEQVSKQLSELSEINPNIKTWKKKFQLLKEAVLSHVQEEESTIFEKAKQILTTQQANELTKQMKQLKKEKMKTTS